MLLLDDEEEERLRLPSRGRPGGGRARSYYIEWASGPAVVLTAFVIFVVAYAVSTIGHRRLPEAALDAHAG